jgi:hypothetical protein
MGQIPNEYLQPTYFSRSKEDGSRLTATDTLKKLLNNFSVDVIDYVHDMEPQSNNLFYAGFFREKVEQGDAVGSMGHNELEIAPYRIQNITVGMSAFSTVVDPASRIVNIDKITHDQSIQISWREDVRHSIKKYHFEWASMWYNKNFDVLIVGEEGKFRRLGIVAFHYINGSGDDTPFDSPMIEPLFLLDVVGIVPEDFGKFSFGDDGNDATVNITYKASRISWLYFDNTSPWHPTDLAADDSIAEFGEFRHYNDVEVYHSNS